jgi:hypothetical protein
VAPYKWKWAPLSAITLQNNQAHALLLWRLG